MPTSLTTDHERGGFQLWISKVWEKTSGTLTYKKSQDR